MRPGCERRSPSHNRCAARKRLKQLMLVAAYYQVYVAFGCEAFVIAHRQVRERNYYVRSLLAKLARKPFANRNRVFNRTNGPGADIVAVSASSSPKIAIFAPPISRMM